MRASNLLFSHSSPFRRFALALTRKLELGSFGARVRLGAVERPHYAYCVYNAGVLAKRLGYESISVLEFGVAGGNGLRVLERHAADASAELGIEIQVYGFDTAEGLPPPLDYRDLPYHWQAGFFAMDQQKLEGVLTTAQLVLGNIEQTSKDFFAAYRPAPVGAVMHDFDLYSSTATALEMFDVEESSRLPRVYCYFDDIIGTELELYNDFTGERLAIEEFNQSHATKKLSKAYHLVSRRRVQKWYHQIFILHDFEHSRYNDFVSTENQQLPLA